MKGPPTPELSATDLDALAQISASDREAAAAAWKADAPSVARNLLDATEHTGDA